MSEREAWEGAMWEMSPEQRIDFTKRDAGVRTALRGLVPRFVPVRDWDAAMRASDALLAAVADVWFHWLREAEIERDGLQAAYTDACARIDRLRDQLRVQAPGEESVRG